MSYDQHDHYETLGLTQEGLPTAPEIEEEERPEHPRNCRCRSCRKARCDKA